MTMILFHVLTALIATLLTPSTQCFAPKSVGRSTNTCTRVTNESKLQGKHNPDEETNGRRTFLTKTVGTLATIGATTLSPLTASAGIDLSGLSPTTTTPPKTGTIADQLRAYDTSPTQRAPPPERPSTPTIPPPTVPAGVATSVTRTSTAPPFLRRAQLGTMSRLEDTLQAPSGSKLRTLSVSFEFPSDWLQLDRVLGGVEFVDQRNGDKLYVLRAELPEGKTLETVEKGWFGEAIFDPRGTIAKGLEIDGYRVVDSRVSSSVGACPEGACSYSRRRLGVKYSTVTGNGYRVERRALVDAYEVDSVAYMLMATQNAVKFEAKGRERETVEAMVNSFRLER